MRLNRPSAQPERGPSRHARPELISQPHSMPAALAQQVGEPGHATTAMGRTSPTIAAPMLCKAA